jgi:hypothetical protein
VNHLLFFGGADTMNIDRALRGVKTFAAIAFAKR